MAGDAPFGTRRWMLVGLIATAVLAVLAVLAVASSPDPTPVRVLDAEWVGPERLALTLDNCGDEDRYEPEVERTASGFEVTVWYTARIPTERLACADAVGVRLPGWDGERIVDGATGSSIVVTDGD